ncbi:hypothetical protein AK830_g10385 [Neonectria ditissima]|uniref:Uncharacterized protein n=1 Tax=Neonectria ditissima TaxID=78410 RepID=A0A0P7B3V2_9HYPO|nr:hypothetical protein AK830_g10385 [Neonectria ditissima]
MKSFSILLLAAGLVSAAAVPLQSTERRSELALRQVPAVAAEVIKIAARSEAATPVATEEPAKTEEPVEGEEEAVDEEGAVDEEKAKEPVEGDADGNGIPDAEEEVANEDANGNGIPDAEEKAEEEAAQEDANGNGVPDAEEEAAHEDANGNGVPDAEESAEENKEESKDENKDKAEQIDLNAVLSLAPQIEGLVAQMGMSGIIDLGNINSLGFVNQIVVLSQLQQVRTLQVFNLIGSNDVLVLLSNGVLASSGINVIVGRSDSNTQGGLKNVSYYV